MTFLGDDGREKRDSHGYFPARRADVRKLRYVTRRSCDGWPEVGSCSGHAMRGCDYCRDCEDLRLAHEGGETIRTDDEDEDSEGGRDD